MPEITKTKIIANDLGLHIADSVLWLDNHTEGHTSFFSGVNSLSKAKPKANLIAESQAAELLELFQQKPQALICQYNRPFSLGQLTLELLPSGAGLGAASLLFQYKGETNLYINQLSMRKNPVFRRAQLPKVDNLIVQASLPEGYASKNSRKKETYSLLNHIEEAFQSNRQPVVICSAESTAQELYALFCEQQLPVVCHSKISKINKLYEQQGFQLGNSCASEGLNPGKTILIWPAHIRKRSLFKDPTKKILYINEYAHEQLSFVPSEQQFHLPRNFGPEDFEDILKATEPKSVLLAGPYAGSYLSKTNKISTLSKIINPNNQPSLF